MIKNIFTLSLFMILLAPISAQAMDDVQLSSIKLETSNFVQRSDMVEEPHVRFRDNSLSFTFTGNQEKGALGFFLKSEDLGHFMTDPANEQHFSPAVGVQYTLEFNL